ncbi:hypothetical protein CYMTET_7091 [Cymbomonas tetramitiformis]|uniref:Uncharacterized protein n=1 Tax=Cymbomonas tetramitiformis TaxID=36881 RepID=A0AAE0LH85_9CHLO|nr:hypothetical protein CYMTET_7091 [Cymbomonas tetramitiformis]
MKGESANGDPKDLDQVGFETISAALSNLTSEISHHPAVRDAIIMHKSVGVPDSWEVTIFPNNCYFAVYKDSNAHGMMIKDAWGVSSKIEDAIEKACGTYLALKAEETDPLNDDEIHKIRGSSYSDGPKNPISELVEYAARRSTKDDVLDICDWGSPIDGDPDGRFIVQEYFSDTVFCFGVFDRATGILRTGCTGGPDDRLSKKQHAKAAACARLLRLLN